MQIDNLGLEPLPMDRCEQTEENKYRWICFFLMTRAFECRLSCVDYMDPPQVTLHFFTYLHIHTYVLYIYTYAQIGRG